MITEIQKKITEIKDRDPLTEKIIACAYKVHSELGPGFNERIYHNALEFNLKEENLRYESEKEYRVIYHDKYIGSFRTDLVIENKVIIEVKAVLGLLPKVFETQVLSYLKISDLNVALLINFGNKSCQVRRLMI